MTITDSVRATIISAFRKKGLSKKELSEIMGHQPAWVTKLFDGTLKSLTEDNIRKLERALDVEFFRVTRTEQEVSGLGIKVSNKTKDNPALLSAIEAILNLSEEQVFVPHWHTTKQLTALGAELERFVFANEGKHGKIGRFVIELVSQDPNKRKRRRDKFPTARPEDLKPAEHIADSGEGEKRQKG